MVVEAAITWLPIWCKFAWWLKMLSRPHANISPKSPKQCSTKQLHAHKTCTGNNGQTARWIKKPRDMQQRRYLLWVWCLGHSGSARRPQTSAPCRVWRRGSGGTSDCAPPMACPSFPTSSVPPCSGNTAQGPYALRETVVEKESAKSSKLCNPRLLFSYVHLPCDCIMMLNQRQSPLTLRLHVQSFPHSVTKKHPSTSMCPVNDHHLHSLPNVVECPLFSLLCKNKYTLQTLCAL